MNNNIIRKCNAIQMINKKIAIIKRMITKENYVISKYKKDTIQRGLHITYKERIEEELKNYVYIKRVLEGEENEKKRNR